MNQCEYLPNPGVCDFIPFFFFFFFLPLLISNQVKCPTSSGAGQTVFLSMSRRELSACRTCRLPPTGRRRLVFPYTFSRVVAELLFFECFITQLFHALFSFYCFIFNQGVVNLLAQYALYDT